MSKCVICGSEYKKNRGALSRRDGKTEICPECGYREAVEDMEKYMKIKRGV